MQIHVVEPGDTLFSIAKAYHVAPGWIARYNALPCPDCLAVGQSLLVLKPAKTITVRPSDTLFTLAAQHQTTPVQLLRNNPNLQGMPQIYPGQVLAIALEDVPKVPLQVNGYAYPNVQLPILRGILPYTTYLTPFTYGISAENVLVLLEDETLVDLARAYNVSPLLHLSSLTEEGRFSTERAAAVLSNPQLQAILAKAVVQVMENRGYDGLDVDFEYVNAAQAAAYAQFVGQLRTYVNTVQGEVFVALAPKTSAQQPGVLYEGHDYAALGSQADGVLLMTYEWGYTYGPPMAVAPLPSVKRVLDYAVTEIPPEKIFMGFPNYGYDWTLPYQAGESRARSISNEEAVRLAVAVGAEIQYDETAQTPYFHYTDDAGAVHEVWFEDARSCYAKFQLPQQYGFRGIGFWNYMRPFTVGFSLLNVLYRITQS